MRKQEKYWAIQTDGTDPYCWIAIYVFKATEEKAKEFFSFINKNIKFFRKEDNFKGWVILKEFKKKDIYYLTQEDVDNLARVGIDKSIKTPHFIDGDWRKCEIISCKDMENIISRVKNDLKKQKSAKKHKGAK